MTLDDEARMGRAELRATDASPTSCVDARRLAEIETILDRTGVPRLAPDGVAYDVVQRTAVLAAWTRGKRRC
jgi:hypothetical protein